MEIIGTTALNSAQLYVGEFPDFDAEYIQFEFTGTNNAGLQLLPADLGNLLIRTKQFGNIAFIPFSYLFDINNQMGGNAIQTSVVAGAFRLVCNLPMSLIDFNGKEKNAVRFTKNMGLEIYVQNFTVTDVASGTLAISSKYSDAPFKYVPVLDFQDRNLALGQRDVFTINRQNTGKVWIDTHTATLTQILVDSDSGYKCNSDFNKLNADLNFNAKLETVNAAYAFLDLNPSFELVERVGNKINFQVVCSGAGVARFYFQSTIENDLVNDLGKAKFQRFVNKTIDKSVSNPDQRKNIAQSVNLKTAELTTIIASKE